MKCTIVALFVVLPACFGFGCGPSWHSGKEDFTLTHGIDKAEVHGDSLIVMGWISPLVAVTDYGLKVFEARDDTGRELPFKSFQMTYAKGMWFTIELDAPDPKAKSISLDIAFTSRSGPQRIRKDLPITRNTVRDWRARLHSWEPRRSTRNGFGKSVIRK